MLTQNIYQIDPRMQSAMIMFFDGLAGSLTEVAKDRPYISNFIPCARGSWRP